MSASNLTSWADASSDEESDVERIAPPPSNLPGSLSYNGLNYEDDHDGDDEVGNAPHFSVTAKERDYSFLFENPPPYTAYIGKLSYEMKTSDDFGVEVERLLRGRGCVANTDKGGKFLFSLISFFLVRLMFHVYSFFCLHISSHKQTNTHTFI